MAGKHSLQYLKVLHESGSPELGTKSVSPGSSLLLEADREDQIPVTLLVTPQVIDDVTSIPTGDTRLQGVKRLLLLRILTVAHLRYLIGTSIGWANRCFYTVVLVVGCDGTTIRPTQENYTVDGQTELFFNDIY
eukprot:scaffold7242_cov137-Cylindrotheca_fusiformis.AAC.6